MQLLHLVLLILNVTMTAAVPGCHSDRDKDDRPMENCTAGGFDDLPADLPLETKVLLFPNNRFSSLSWTSFQIFTDIYEIDLSYNKLQEVTSTLTSILPTLTVLRLSSNLLTSLPDASFSACPFLVELYLDRNVISSLRDESFSGLSKLEILDLTSNQITVLPDRVLHPLRAIETLYLENNKIRLMPDDWFSQKEEVPYLYLSANPWACFCSLSYLHRYLGDNELNVYVRDGVDIKGDVESVVCDSPPRLRGTPVINLEEMDLCHVRRSDGEEVFEITEDTTSMIPPTTVPTTPPTTLPATVPTTRTSPAFRYSDLLEVVTRSWFQTFTSFSEWSEVETKKSSVWFHETFEQTLRPPFRRLTEQPAPAPVTKKAPVLYPTTKPVTVTTTTPALLITKAAVLDTTTKLVTVTTTTPAPVTSTTPFQLTAMMLTPPSRAVVHRVVGSSGGAEVFCLWLLGGCLLLAVASALSTLLMLGKMLLCYRRVYTPLRHLVERRRGLREEEMTLMHSGMEENRVMALYRSVLFVHKEREDAAEDVMESEGGEGRSEVFTLKLEGAREAEREERGVYRKTLYRLVSREQEIEGWRDVMEECRVPTEGGGRKRGGGGKKRYSVILREEREEPEGGKEELDLVVGGWEVQRVGDNMEAEPRSSWGEWLASYLPSMPWGVSTPPENVVDL